jgi:hypothetical protein
MTLMNQHDVAWLLQTVAKKMGFWGLLCVCITGLSAAYYYSNIVSTQQRIVEAEATIAQQSSSNKRNAPIETIAQPTNSPKALADFYRTFPTESAIPDTLTEINRLAAKQGIYLNSGDYKLNKIKVQRGTASTPALTQYEMVLPLESSYPSIRALTVSILRQLPSVAVSDIQMMRDSTLSPLIEAKLVLVLFVRGD